MNEKATSVDSAMTYAEYLQYAGTRCPVCRSQDIEGMGLEMDGSYVVQGCCCNACKSTWDDLYHLSGIENLEVGQ